MRILLTNDDGVRSLGLLTLKQALEPLGELSIVAPERNWSASGHGRTLFTPLRVTATTLADGSPALACDGTPADCVALAALGLLPERPDVVISGINHGANLGHDVLYSGTVAAAMEGLVCGIPSLAISLVDGFRPEADFAAAGLWARRVVGAALKRGWPSDVLLNVNIPLLPAAAIQGVQVTRLGQRVYRDELIVREDPRGQPYYWIGGAAPTGIDEAGTDFGAIHAGCVTITPLHFDLTGSDWIERLQAVRWDQDPAAENIHGTL